MKKTFTKVLIGYAAMLMLMSCQSTTITFTFEYQCSEDLLDFVIPSATYKNAKGQVRVIELDKTNLIKEDNSGLVADKQQELYTWRCDIILPGTSTAQRDMLINYKLRNDAPVIVNDKEYMMVHHLKGTSKKETSSWWNSSVSVNTSVEVVVDPTENTKIQGSQLQTYLNNLVANPDYIKKEEK